MKRRVSVGARARLCAASAFAVAIPMACFGGSTAEQATVDETVFIESPDCDLVRDLYYLPPPSEPPAPRSKVDAELAAIDEALGALAGTEVADLHVFDDYVAVNDAFQQAMLDAWGDDGVDLKEQADMVGSVTEYLLADGSLPLVDGGRFDYDAFVELRQLTLDRLLVACLERPDGLPELPGADVDALPEVTLLVSDPDDFPGQRTLTLPAARLGPGVSDAVVGQLSADRSRGVAVGGGQIRIIDMDSGHVEVLEWAGNDWEQGTSWLSDGRLVGVMAELPMATNLAIIDIDAKRVTTFESDSDDYMPFEVEEGLILYASDGGIWRATVEDDGGLTQHEELWSKERCVMIPNWARRTDGVGEILINCDDPYQDGLYEIDLVSGETTHVLAGMVGLGEISPDGDYRAFTLAEPGTPSLDSTLHVADADLTRVWDTGMGKSFPLFLD